MTDRKQKLDAITDSIYYYMVEIISQANELESIGCPNAGEELRSIADQLERLGIRLLNNRTERRHCRA